MTERGISPFVVNVHTLLRVRGAEQVMGESSPPTWVGESLRRAPWVVVRRAASESLVPVGVRGELRRQRFAAWVRLGDAFDYATPQTLASGQAWRQSPRYAQIPALAELDHVQDIMSEHGLSEAWGPAGSVGFELASGCATARPDSDLDLVINSEPLVSVSLVRSLHAALAKLAVRTDVLCETRRGGVALAEYARTPDAFMLRTVDGPRLVGQRLL